MEFSMRQKRPGFRLKDMTPSGPSTLPRRTAFLQRCASFCVALWQSGCRTLPGSRTLYSTDEPIPDVWPGSTVTDPTTSVPAIFPPCNLRSVTASPLFTSPPSTLYLFSSVYMFLFILVGRSVPFFHCGRLGPAGLCLLWCPSDVKALGSSLKN